MNAGRIAVGQGASFFTHEGGDALIDLDGPTGTGRVLVSGTSLATIAVRLGP